MVCSRINCQRIAEGATAEIFAWDEDSILKLYYEETPPGEAEQEAIRASIAYDAGLNTPVVIDTSTVEDRQEVISEKVHGITMLEAILANPQKLVPYVRILAELQSNMHMRTACKLPPQRQWLRRKIQSVSELPGETKAALLTRLDRLQDRNAICHGDFHPENLLITAEEPVIIDWVDSTQGSPLLDLARTSLILRVGELPPTANERYREKLGEMRHLFYEAHLEHYARVQSISREALTRWVSPVAAARLSDGIGNNEKAGLLGILNASFS